MFVCVRVKGQLANSYSNWYSDSPTAETKHCVTVSSSNNWAWTDVDCTSSQNYYICEAGTVKNFRFHMLSKVTVLLRELDGEPLPRATLDMTEDGLKMEQDVAAQIWLQPLYYSCMMATKYETITCCFSFIGPDTDTVK
jgi:Lectin C-type domain